MIVLDTNDVSELVRQQPGRRVVEWIDPKRPRLRRDFAAADIEVIDPWDSSPGR